MVNLIRVFSVCSMYSLLIGAFSFCRTNKINHHTNDTSFLEIHFQDFFLNDRMGVKFNQCEVFKNLEVSSDKSTGTTGVQIKLFKEHNSYLIRWLDKKFVCNQTNGAISLVIALNGAEHNYSIDISKGKYLGFSKKNKGELSFVQSQTSFVYD